ncbi:MAG: DNA-directed RNA polymerase subunit alpha [Patescibacteria group bacterium]
METFPLPDKYQVNSTDKHQADLIIEPCYPGYGNTLGNALRRVLLSSLSGAAITAFRIKGITHEFSTVPGVKEDIVEIILNLKKIGFKLHGTDETTATLKVKGQKKVIAKDIKLTSEAEVSNPDAEIATLTDKDSEIEMELTIKAGRGYVQVENMDTDKLPLGTIAIDSIFTPIKNVNYNIENVRVGQMTNYDRVIMSITTDGTITPEEALKEASTILVDHFQAITNFGIQPAEQTPATQKAKKDKTESGEQETINEEPEKKKKRKVKAKKE